MSAISHYVSAALVFLAVAASASPERTLALNGSWQLNKTLSDDVSDRLALLKPARRGGFRSGIGSRGKLYRPEDEERALAFGRSISVRRVVSAETLRIDGTERLALIFGESIERKLMPNPNGKVYSASGNELLTDSIGHNLSFWHRDTLVVETATHSGMDYIERYRVNAAGDELRIFTVIKPPGQTALELLRVFDKVAEAGGG